MATLTQKKALAILGNIQERDRVIRENKTRRIKRLVPRRIGSRRVRLFVRQAFFNQQSRNIARKTIRKRGIGFTVKLGGLKRGRIQKVKTRATALKAVNTFLDQRLVERLGSRGAAQAKALFRIQ